MPPGSSVATYLGLLAPARLGQDDWDLEDLADPGDQVVMDRADQEGRQDPEDPGARGAMDQGHQVDLQMDQYQ